MKMRRGELYLGSPPDDDPRRQRVYLVVSREELVASRYSKVICAPVYSQRGGLPTEVSVGEADGLKVASAIRCDELTSVPRDWLRRHVGTLAPTKMRQVAGAMAIALEIQPEDIEDL
jgi:mRNA interferase MazF